MSVTAREFTLTLSRPLVGAGEVTIELRNYGEDPHDLVVERSGTEVGRWGDLGPGAVGKKTLTLTLGQLPAPLLDRGPRAARHEGHAEGGGLAVELAERRSGKDRAKRRKKLTRKQKRAKCLKAAKGKRTSAKRRAAAKRCRRKYPLKKRVVKKPAAVRPQPVPPPPAPRPSAPSTINSPIAKYSGAFGVRQAERLLWRAGFGPSPGHAQALVNLGHERAVLSLTRPAGAPVLTGAAPTDGDGPLAPDDAWGHDHLWFLDRMVRTNQPLIERMTLIWHDWFATSTDGAEQRYMLDQNALFRRHALGSFRQLALDVTADPAMIQWLNQTENTR